MKVSIVSFTFQGFETLFITSHCGKYGVDIDVLNNSTFHYQPVAAIRV